MRQNVVKSLAVEELSSFFRALGDPNRVRIVALLAHGELCVCHIQQALTMSQPNASQHLGVLKHAGVVESRRVGSWIYYRLAQQADEQRRKHLQSLVRAFSDEETLRADVERLVRSRGPGACK